MRISYEIPAASKSGSTPPRLYEEKVREITDYLSALAVNGIDYRTVGVDQDAADIVITLEYDAYPRSEVYSLITVRLYGEYLEIISTPGSSRWYKIYPQQALDLIELVQTVCVH